MQNRINPSFQDVFCMFPTKGFWTSFIQQLEFGVATLYITWEWENEKGKQRKVKHTFKKITLIASECHKQVNSFCTTLLNPIFEGFQKANK